MGVCPQTCYYTEKEGSVMFQIVRKKELNDAVTLMEISAQMMVRVWSPMRSSSLLATTAMGMVRFPPWLTGITKRNAPIRDGMRNLKKRGSFKIFMYAPFSINFHKNTNPDNLYYFPSRSKRKLSKICIKLYGIFSTQ